MLHFLIREEGLLIKFRSLPSIIRVNNHPNLNKQFDTTDCVTQRLTKFNQSFIQLVAMCDFDILQFLEKKRSAAASTGCVFKYVFEIDENYEPQNPTNK